MIWSIIYSYFNDQVTFCLRISYVHIYIYNIFWWRPLDISSTPILTLPSVSHYSLPISCALFIFFQSQRLCGATSMCIHGRLAICWILGSLPESAPLKKNGCPSPSEIPWLPPSCMVGYCPVWSFTSTFVHTITTAMSSHVQHSSIVATNTVSLQSSAASDSYNFSTGNVEMKYFQIPITFF